MAAVQAAARNRQLCLGGEPSVEGYASLAGSAGGAVGNLGGAAASADGAAATRRLRRRRPELEYPSLRQVTTVAVPWMSRIMKGPRGPGPWVARRSEGPEAAVSGPPSPSAEFQDALVGALVWPEGIYAPTTQPSRLPSLMVEGVGAQDELLLALVGRESAVFRLRADLEI